MCRDSECACLVQYLHSDFWLTLYLLRLNGVFHIKFSKFLATSFNESFSSGMWHENCKLQMARTGEIVHVFIAACTQYKCLRCLLWCWLVHGGSAGDTVRIFNVMVSSVNYRNPQPRLTSCFSSTYLHIEVQ